MKHIIATLLLIKITALTYAHEGRIITGRITDQITGESLPGVNIIIPTLRLGGVTNSDGEYKLSNIPKGQYQLMVSFIGYADMSQDINLNAQDSIRVNFKLIAKSESINEIIVSAKSKARELREQAMPISVISMNQLSGTVNSVSDVLSKTVGVTMRTTGGVGSAARVSVRGLEGKRIGFFIDETPLSEHTDFIDINDLPVELIDRIEIYKGVVPAKFGGSAIGGAVNIITKEYPPRYLDAAYAIESFNTHKISSVVKRNIVEKGVEFGLGGFYTYSDNDYEMTLPLENNIKVKRDHDQFEKITIGSSVTAKNWWFDQVKFEPVFIKSRKQIQGIEQNIQEAESFSDAYILANHTEKMDFLTEGLDLDFSLAYAYTIFKFQDKAKVRYNWDGTTYETESIYGGEINKFPSDSRNQQHVIQQKTNLNYIINQSNSLNFNLVYKYMKGLPEDTLKDLAIGYQTNFDSDMNSSIVGLSYEYKGPNEKWLNVITAKHYFYAIETQLVKMLGITGVEDINMKKNNYGVSNAMRYKFLPDFLAKASLAYDMRLPNESELLGDGFVIAPAGNLEPERNTSFNLGLLLDRNGKSKHNLQIELSGYYMYLKNMIRLTGGLLQTQYENFGEMESKGVEFEIKGDINSWLYGYGNANYQDSRDTREFEQGSETNPNPNKGKRMPNIPFLMANVGLEFHKENLFGGKDHNTRLFADGSFIEEYSYDFEQSTLYKERVIPRALTLNLGFEHSLKNGAYIISAKVNNVNNATVISEFNRPMPGRNFGIKLRYMFK